MKIVYSAHLDIKDGNSKTMIQRIEEICKLNVFPLEFVFQNKEEIKEFINQCKISEI